MTEVTPPAAPQPAPPNPSAEQVSGSDPIPAELERALFKRFWAWLAIVGTIVIVVVSGFSVIASQLVASLVDDRVKVAIDKIANLEKRSLDSIDRIETRALESAISISGAQAKSQVAADSTQAALISLQSKINSIPPINDLVKDTESIVTALVGKKEFADRVSMASLKASQQSLSRLLEWPPGEAVQGPRVDTGGTTMCPPGHYAVGLTSVGNTAPPYCIGCLVATQIICRKLNVDRAAQ
ncbi:hypothetical protein [Bradyrhizobium vignae]|uniref:Uncharacterized protein n=1 Tax=Bradyrhizobium vignae TaxID=1549949 RepID=A0ABS3ZSD8_9BRAD|nr:hypothetical protein [Bradyrhizobium vignae]MBP0111062.1 hypothetical protein [Bradyrhizobium vignae]